MTRLRRLRSAALACVIILPIVVAGCRGGNPAAAQPAAGAKPAAVTSDAQAADDAMLVKVSRAIRTAKLTKLEDRCLAYTIEPVRPQGAAVVDVRENHREAVCGGDPATQPMLFRVKVEAGSAAMTTDAGTPGTFHGLGR